MHADRLSTSAEMSSADDSNAAGTIMWEQSNTAQANAAMSPAASAANKAARGFSADSSSEQEEADATTNTQDDSTTSDRTDPSTGSSVNAAAAAAAAHEFDLAGLNSEASPPSSSSLLESLMAPSDAFLATSHPQSQHNTASSAAAAAAAAAQARADDPFGLGALSGSASSSTSNVSSPGPSSPQSTKGTARHSANHSGSKAAAAPGSSPLAGPSNSAGLPAGMPSLSVSSSQDNLFNVPSEASPVVSSTTAAAGTSTAANPGVGGASAKPEKTVTGRLLRMFNPFSSSGSGSGSGSATAAPGVPAPAGSPITQPMPSPSPPPSAGLGASAANTGVVSPHTPFTPVVSATMPSSASSTALSAQSQSPGSGAVQSGVPIVPKSYSYQDFAAKMKLPGAQDLVKTLKNYVKQVQSPEWFAAHSSHPSVVSKSSTEFDRIRTEYNDTITSIMRLIRTKHPLWKGASEEELDNSLESIEKFLTSKLYERFFYASLWPQQRMQDTAVTEKLFILHTWVRPAHLDLPAYCCADPRIWDHPSEELRSMDKFKSPRDKLVCLLNCCHIINNILKRAKQKENAEKAAASEARRKAREKERMERAERDKKESATAKEDAKPVATTDSTAEDLTSPPPAASPISPPAATVTAAAVAPPGGSLASARRLSLEDHMVPSSSPSADDFFPALIYTLIHARPAHLYLNVVYISLCRYESKLSGGEAAYWYTNLASAIQFVESCNAKSFSFAKPATTTAAANATETDATPTPPVAAAAPAEKSTHRKGAAAVLGAEEARAEYQRLMDQGEVLLREQRAAEAAEAAEATRKAEAVAAAAAAAAEAKRIEQAEMEAAAASAAVFMSAAAIDVMPPVPSVPAAAPAASAGPAVASAAAASASAVASTSAAAAPPSSAFEHNHGPSSWPSGSSSALSGYLLPPPCLACVQLSHRRFAPRFLDREFSDLRVSELQDVLREYKEMCFLIQGWQDHAAHRELKNMPLPPRKETASNAQDDGEGVALSAADDASAAPSSAHVAASSTASAPMPAASAAAAPAPSAAPLGSWPLTNFLGLGMGRSKKG